MKCPHCGEDTRVLETRVHLDVFLKRTRICESGCKRFETFEVYAGNIDKRTLMCTLRGVKARMLAKRRAAYVLAHPEMSRKQLSKNIHVCEARVDQLRHPLRKRKTPLPKVLT